MRLYLMRHGIAEPRAAGGADDAARPLTPDGRRRMARAARGLKRLVPGFDLILTSPLVRARQTAAVVARAFGPALSVSVLAPLAPGGAMEEVLAGLPGRRGVRSILLVGHEPDLSTMAGRLCSGASGSPSLKLKKGALCALEFDEAPGPGAGTLILLLPPRALRLIGAAR